MQLTKSELIERLIDRGVKVKSSATKAQLQELYDFQAREEVNPAPRSDVFVAPNGLKMSMHSAKKAGLI